MKQILTLVKYDYLQRVRSYKFLVIVCLSLIFAYFLIPAPDASYSTVSISDYVGNYNSAWIAYVTALMASTFLSMIGYFLINNSIKIDQETKVGQIVAATSITNFTYLVAKFLGNFLILLTIVMLIFLVSIIMFFMYSVGYEFEISQFLMAYALIPIPTIILISALAVVLEVIFREKSSLQNGVFFILFMVMLVQGRQLGLNSDPFGVGFPTEEIERQVMKANPSAENLGLNIGFMIGHETPNKRFEFTGINPSPIYLLSRLFWSIIGIFIIYMASRFFHRFNLNKRFSSSKKALAQQATIDTTGIQEIDLSLVPKLESSTSIWPVFKTELLLMIRKGRKWLWGLNIIGMALLVFLPLEIAHKIVLPLLWFLQVHRWADLVTKEKNHHMHFFIYSSLKPVQRLLTSQYAAGTALATILALPLILRYLILGDVLPIAAILLGAVFIVALSAFLGIITGGKRLFEVLFLFIAYLNLNGLPYTDYFGGVNRSLDYLVLLGGITLTLGLLGFLFRRLELRAL